MSKYLERFFREFDFSYLGRKVAECKVTENGLEVGVRLNDKRVELKGPDRGQFATLFANWPSDNAGILNFTKKYGPIIPPEKETSKALRFSLDAWRENQRALRAAWSDMSGWKPGWRKDTRLKKLVTQAPRFTVYLEFQRPAYKTYDLRGFLWLSYQTSPLWLHRRCRKPVCNAYFVASRPQQRYCGEKCSRWAMLCDKRKWWNAKSKKQSKPSKKG